MNHLRNTALALYAISSILASSLAIYYQVNRHLRKRRYQDNNHSSRPIDISHYEEIKNHKARKTGPIQHYTYDEWIDDYDKNDRARSN